MRFYFHLYVQILQGIDKFTVGNKIQVQPETDLKSNRFLLLDLQHQAPSIFTYSFAASTFYLISLAVSLIFFLVRYFSALNTLNRH